MSNTSLKKSKIKLLLLEGIHQRAIDAFAASGYQNVCCFPKSLPQEELAAALSDAHFVGIRSRTHLTAEVLAQAPRLAAIGCFCIGTNQVDLEAARERGVPVFNAPFSNTRSVAELVLGEIILLMRGIPERSARAHRGEWLKSAAGSNEVRGKTLGIIGYGHIGSQTSILAEGLGMNVIFHDIEDKLVLGNASRASSLEDLLGESDVVTLHVPDTPNTRNMIGAAQLDQMKQGGILVNASRGTVVDIEPLAERLESGRLRGAAVDVFPTEPKSVEEEFSSPLRGLDNVILTPHVGGSTQEAQQNIGSEVAGKLIRYSDNGSTVTSVNFPQVSLPEHAGKHRLLHIHRNIPGVLAEINKVFSENSINISGQHLQTEGSIGYVVIDIDQKQSQVGLEKLRRVDGTIRCRVLH